MPSHPVTTTRHSSPAHADLRPPRVLPSLAQSTPASLITTRSLGPRPQRTERPHRYPRSHEVGMTDSPRRDTSEPTQSFGSGYPVDYPDPAYSNQPPYQG